jgi:peptidoglycan glycosyltransferase
MSKQIRQVGGALTILLIALLANLTYIQVFQAEELRAMPGNQRAVLEEYSIQRGPILVGSAAAAQSVPTSGGDLKYQREYARGPLYVPATGFDSRLYGSTGLEKAANAVLSGSDDRFFVSRLQQLIAGRDQQGGTVTTTLNAAAQEAAARGIQGKVGAVAAIDPRTGAILTLVQSPSFDPNIIASTSTSESQEYYESLSADPNEPLLNRPLVKLLAPGSTYKVVVAAAALESGRFTPSSVLPGPAEYTLPGTSTQMGNWFDGPCGPNDQVTLEEALVISCNTAFAWLGNQLGEDALREQSQKFGFDTSFDVPMTAAAARFPTDPDEAQVALSSIGQYEVRATALAMAQVTGAIGNDGVTMYPNLVGSISAPDLTVLETLQPRTFAQAMSSNHARQLTDMMVAVVSRGTGSNARIPGVTVGGKTGTAETGNDQPNIAWFIALAPAENPEVAVAVMVENAGTTEVSGNQLAAPIARDVIEAVLGR